VSDRWLAQLGEQLQLESFLVLGPKALGDAAAKQPCSADATEALIGAIYSGSGNNLEPIHQWLTPHWQQTTAEVLATPSVQRQNHSSGMEPSRRLGLPDYTTTEQSSRHGDPERFQKPRAGGNAIERRWLRPFSQRS